jgi:hypothetical protein
MKRSKEILLRAALMVPASLLCAALQTAPASSASSPASQEAPEAMPRLLRAGTPEPSGPFDIPLPMWIVLGTCAALGTAGLTISWRQKKKKQRRPAAMVH